MCDCKTSVFHVSTVKTKQGHLHTTHMQNMLTPNAKPEREQLTIPPVSGLVNNKAELAMGFIPCMTGCCQKQRRCHIEPCCQWTCRDSWWRCFPRHSFSTMDHAATTWCVQAAPWSHRSSLCPRHAPLQRETQGHGLGFLGRIHFQLPDTAAYVKGVVAAGKPNEVRKLDLRVSPPATQIKDDKRSLASRLLHTLTFLSTKGVDCLLISCSRAVWQ